MTPIARTIVVTIATLFTLTTSEARAGDWHRHRYWVAPDAYCQYEPSRRGYGPTLELTFVYRCYSEDALLPQHRAGVYVVRARG